MNSISDSVKNKTFKREYASLLLVVLSYIVLMDRVEMAQVIVFPFLSFAALAFGLDWKSKQDVASK